MSRQIIRELDVMIAGNCRQKPSLPGREPAGTEENKMNPSRREVMKNIIAGGTVAGVLALAGTWSKPVVDSIILPAHAQATNVEVPSPTTTIIQDNTTENIIYCQCNAAAPVTLPSVGRSKDE